MGTQDPGVIMRFERGRFAGGGGGGPAACREEEDAPQLFVGSVSRALCGPQSA